MDKLAVIRHLQEMADLLEIGAASPFQIAALRNAARSLVEWEGDLAAAVAAGTVRDIDRVGKGIAATISELVTDGRAVAHDEVRRQFPEHLPELLTLSGVGPKKVRTLWRELGVESLADLEAAGRAGRVQSLKGFGKKTEAKILAAIERRRTAVASPRSAAPSASATRPEATGRLLLGTSGYSHEEWRGAFYPEALKKADFLPFYAERFATVEINNSFYRFPSETALRGWRSQVPDDFLFAVKANQRISHHGRLKGVQEVTESFTARCRVLGAHLGPILVQLPPDLPRCDDRLAAFLESLDPSVRFALEFRHDSWHDDAVFARLREHRVALVVHDGSPRVATGDFVYVRLRRVDYDAAELESWRAFLQAQAAARRDAFVYLKHDKGGETPERVLTALSASSEP